MQHIVVESGFIPVPLKCRFAFPVQSRQLRAATAPNIAKGNFTVTFQLSRRLFRSVDAAKSKTIGT